MIFSALKQYYGIVKETEATDVYSLGYHINSLLT